MPEVILYLEKLIPVGCYIYTMLNYLCGNIVSFNTYLKSGRMDLKLSKHNVIEKGIFRFKSTSLTFLHVVSEALEQLSVIPLLFQVFQVLHLHLVAVQMNPQYWVPRGVDASEGGQSLVLQIS